MTEQRYRAVLEVQAGVPVTEVAERFGVSRQAVHRWRRWCAGRPAGPSARRSRRRWAGSACRTGCSGRGVQAGIDGVRYAVGGPALLRELDAKVPGDARSVADTVAAELGIAEVSYRKMLQNLGWAAGYNVIAIPLAAGVMAGAGFTLSPAIGAVLMSASTIVVALNAQLLRRVDLTRS